MIPSSVLIVAGTKGGFNDEKRAIKEDTFLTLEQAKGNNLKWNPKTTNASFSILIQVTEGEAETKQTHTTL